MDRQVRIEKIQDEKFGGQHPNGIDVGYVKTGTEVAPPKVGQRYVVLRGLGSFQTSVVTEIIDANTFRTENSIYSIKYEESRKDNVGIQQG